MKTFEFTGAFPRVVFGRGTLSQAPQVIMGLGCRATLVLSTQEQISLGERVVKMAPELFTGGLYSRATMHTPTHVTEEALSLIREKHVDSIVSVGGGSTIGLGKALCVRTGLPHLCIPTTYAGSEMTPILGETENGRKTTRRDPKILPTVVLYDSDLTLTLPARMSVHSGINAVAHAVEALYASNTNPVINLMAAEGIRAMAEGLPRVQEDPRDQDARDKTLYAAWLCGLCLGAVDMALHHKLCHTLGGTFNLPHAETHVAILPHAIAYNSKAAPEAMKAIANALPGSKGDAVRGIVALYQQLGIAVTLESLGMPEDGINKATEIAALNPYKNPAPIEAERLRVLIRGAWEGGTPGL
ncbi:hypothetical protein ACHAQA_005126 [Verticillium albo-atrum]